MKSSPALALVALLGIATAAAAGPGSVVITGNLQSEAGCVSDIQPDCANTALVRSAGDGVWRRTFSLPAGSFNYFAALDGTLDVVYGRNGIPSGFSPVTLNLPAPTAVSFYFDEVTHWVTDSVTSVIASLAGNFQSELGCAADFQPGCLRSWLQDVDGDGLYTFTTTDIPAGLYSTVVAINESFDESYGRAGVPGVNYEFTAPGSGLPVTFTYDARTHLLDIDTGVPPIAAVPEAPSLWLMGLGVALVPWLRRRARNSTSGRQDASNAIAGGARHNVA